jgi:hypothetical protein
MLNRRALVVFSMVAVALITTYASSGSDDQPTLKTGGLYRVAKADAPICETHDELVAAAYEYDGGGTPDMSAPGASSVIRSHRRSCDCHGRALECNQPQC